MSFNKIILMGNLTRDPEIRYTQSGTAVTKCGIAVDGGYGDKKTTTFVDITLFGKKAEAFEKYHKKGGAVLVEGELRLDTWEDKNSGQKRSKLYVIANSWEFTAAAGESRGTEAPAPPNAGDWDPFE